MENHISPYFHIAATKYGGRGCFANNNIASNTQIHQCPAPIGFTISRPFKKEVCSWCYEYQHGSYAKVKIAQLFGKDTCSINFCSEVCKIKFQTIDDKKRVLVQNLLSAEKNYLVGLNKTGNAGNDEDMEVTKLNKESEVDDYSREEWGKVQEWDAQISRMKESKRLNHLVRLDDGEFSEAKYVITVLFQMYKYCNNNKKNNTTTTTTTTATAKYFESDFDTQLEMELNLFQTLQSTEIEKYHKYPSLVSSYIKIYKFVKITCTPELQPFITPLTVRSIIGRNLSNAFGLWSETQDSNEDKEFLGFAVYPSASFFNHSCEPNIKKIRVKNELKFVTLREIAPGEELCINYGNFQNENVKERKKQLSEWFFDCGCTKCEADSQNVIKD